MREPSKDEITEALDAYYGKGRSVHDGMDQRQMRAALLAAAKVRPAEAKPVDWGQIGFDTNVAINQAFDDAARCGVGFVQITPDKSACIPPERVFFFASGTLPCEVMLPPATRIGVGCCVEVLMTALDQRRDRPPQPFTVFARAEKAEAERDELREMNRIYAKNNPKGYAAANRERERAERAEAERDAAKAILSKCADAIGNGAVVSPDCSIEFMSCIPLEIGLHVASLTEDLGETKEQRDRLAAELEKAISLYRDVCEIPPGERDQPAWAIMPSDEPFIGMILAALTSAVEGERERCARIMDAARAGDIDTDLRSIKEWIASGEDPAIRAGDSEGQS